MDSLFHFIGKVLHCRWIDFSAESIPTLKNRESNHFDFLVRGFVEKESILYYITIHDVK